MLNFKHSMFFILFENELIRDLIMCKQVHIQIVYLVSVILPKSNLRKHFDTLAATDVAFFGRHLESCFQCLSSGFRHPYRDNVC